MLFLRPEANCERVFKDAGTVMGAGRDATHSKTARLMVQVPYNAKEGRLKPNRTGARRQYDELLANRELPYPKKKAGK